VFEPLVRSQIRDIVGLRATALVERVAAQHIRMLLGDSALDFLAAKVGCVACCCVIWADLLTNPCAAG
jgi:ATP-dependent Clp protease ATP-binding subunit ClpA